MLWQPKIKLRMKYLQKDRSPGRVGSRNLSQCMDRNQNKRALTQFSDNFNSTTSGTILSARLKADDGCIDKIQ